MFTSVKKQRNAKYRMTKNIIGMTLAQAFVISRRDGFDVNVASIDGARVNDVLRSAKSINVIVENDIIRRAWS